MSSGMRCGLGDTCGTDSDCDNSLSCHAFNNTYAECASCLDGVQDGDESDVDCGGKHCERCAAPLKCKKDKDCLSDKCKGGQVRGRARLGRQLWWDMKVS